MKRLIGITALGLGLTLVLLLSLHPSDAAEPRRLLHQATAAAPASLQPAWDKMGSTLALMLAAEEPRITLSPRTPLGHIQVDI